MDILKTNKFNNISCNLKEKERSGIVKENSNDDIEVEKLTDNPYKYLQRRDVEGRNQDITGVWGNEEDKLTTQNGLYKTAPKRDIYGRNQDVGDIVPMKFDSYEQLDKEFDKAVLKSLNTIVEDKAISKEDKRAVLSAISNIETGKPVGYEGKSKINIRVETTSRDMAITHALQSVLDKFGYVFSPAAITAASIEFLYGSPMKAVASLVGSSISSKDFLGKVYDELNIIEKK